MLHHVFPIAFLRLFELDDHFLRSAVEPSRNGVLKTELQNSITKLEEVWEGEACGMDAGDQYFF